MTLSRFGLVVQAVRGDPERVRFLGYNVAGYETAIYTVSGFIAALAGCCWVTLTQYVSPAQFDTTLQPFDGDLGRHRRPAVAARLDHRRVHHPGRPELSRRHVPQYLAADTRRFFILVVRFLPKGLVGLLESLLARFPIRAKRRNGNGLPAHQLYPQAGE